ncbi:TPA: hypothetical protein I7171_23070 [Vibrio vulnificus]|nr:hypothetical protein [Vibrio vulnificus]
MHIIKQNDTTGCGLACIAALLEIEYEVVKKIASNALCWSERKKVFRTQPDQIVKLLAYYGVASSVTTFSEVEMSATASILGVNSDSNRNFHWVIHIPHENGNLIFDPETAELYQCQRWLNIEGGYQIRQSSKKVVSTSIKIGEIKI